MKRDERPGPNQEEKETPEEIQISDSPAVTGNRARWQYERHRPVPVEDPIKEMKVDARPLKRWAEAKLPIAHPLRAAVILEDDELDTEYFVEAIRVWMRLSEVVQ